MFKFVNPKLDNIALSLFRSISEAHQPFCALHATHHRTPTRRRMTTCRLRLRLRSGGGGELIHVRQKAFGLFYCDLIDYLVLAIPTKKFKYAIGYTAFFRYL